MTSKQTTQWGEAVNPSNLLSLARCPLAFLFLIQSPFYRCLAIGFAMVTDALDGFFARKWKTESGLGALLDPLMDKFFAIFALSTLFHENALSTSELFCLLGREFALGLFFVCLLFTNSLQKYPIRAVWSGKLFTVLQLLIILALSATWSIPHWVYLSLLPLSFGVLIELLWTRRRRLVSCNAE
ncbi:MAG: CDP-alcohol phosphatidyltransferase family protein [Chlamydiia bacterium]|nr:CDP-alcohol phosphatidyltransferase family protein [Chlamydiia bacterium]